MIRWVHMDEKALKKVVEILRSKRMSAAAKELTDQIKHQDRYTPAERSTLEAAAQRLYGSECIEVDPDAPLSHGSDPGVWVGAWLWVPFTELLGSGVVRCERDGQPATSEGADGELLCTDCAMEEQDVARA